MRNSVLPVAGGSSTESTPVCCAPSAPPATFYAIQGGNDLGWRVETPARAIGARVCVMPEVGAAYSVMLPNDDTEFRWHIQVGFPSGETEVIRNPDRWQELCDSRAVLVEGSGKVVFPDHAGTAIWTRPDLARASHARFMRQNGVRTLAEVDDNYLSDPKLNHFMRHNGFDATARLDHMKSLASMDGVIVTTEWLRDEYHRAFKKELRHSPEMFVCGNHVDLARWPERVPSEDGRLRVGFMGSPSHDLDIKLAFPALKWAADNGHHVIMVGYDPKWRRFFDYTHVPWTTPAEYRRVGLPFDVGVAPLRVDRHTMGKSDIKPLEYGMSGAACVASSHPVYTRSYKHEEHVLFGSARWELQYQVERVCRDRGLRESLVETMQAYVREERDISKRKSEWLEAIRG